MTKKRDDRTILASNSESADACPIIAIELDCSDSQERTRHHEFYVLDINSNGMGVSCEVMLKVGQKISFKQNDLDWDLPEKGIVMWTFKAQEGFRAGIKFLF